MPIAVSSPAPLTPAAAGMPADAAPVLNRLAVFSALPREARDRIVASATARPFAAGQTLGQAGAPATHLHIILDGYVRITAPGPATGGEDSATIDVCGPGTVFGETAISGQGSYVASAVTVSDGQEALIPAAVFRACLLDYPDVIPGLLGAVSASLRGLLAQVTDLKLKTTTQRLAMFLMQQVPPEHDPASGQPVRLVLPYSKRTLALKLGMTPETLSRAFAKLDACGVRSCGRTALILTDCASLAAFSGLDEDLTP